MNQQVRPKENTKGVMDQISDYGLRFLGKVSGVAHNIVETVKETTEKIIDKVIAIDEDDVVNPASEYVPDRHLSKKKDEYTYIPLKSRKPEQIVKSILYDLIDKAILESQHPSHQAKSGHKNVQIVST